MAASGNWTIDIDISPAAFRQNAAGKDCRMLYTAPGSDAWANYTLTLQARKLGGSEGFLVDSQHVSRAAPAC
jgi:hypothetical protein